MNVLLNECEHFFLCFNDKPKLQCRCVFVLCTNYDEKNGLISLFVQKIKKFTVKTSKLNLLGLAVLASLNGF